MRQDRFTEKAQEALAASQMLVRQYKHSQWDVEHVLMALLEQQSGLVGDIFKELGVDSEAVKTEVAAALERTPKMNVPTLGITAIHLVATTGMTIQVVTIFRVQIKTYLVATI